MTGLAAAPDVRLTAHIFEQVYGTPPTSTHHVRGALPLLDGLAAPLPWGTVVAAGRSDDGSTSFYSMNHHAQGVVTPATAGEWACECIAALNAYANPGTHLVVNREIPVQTGLLTGIETRQATSRALQDLYGEPENPMPAPPAHLPCDLTGTGFRLLVIDVGARESATTPPADPDAAERAAALLSDRPADLGQLLTDAHSPGSPTHDDTLEAALDAGALGGRTIGACVVILAPATAIPAIRKEVTTRLAPDLHRPPRYLAV